jgi:hypothetical protein
MSSSPPPRTKYLGRDPALFIVTHQVDSLVTLDIDGERLVLVLSLTWSLGQMHMYDALTKRALDVELEAQMLCAPLVRLFGAAQIAIARPSRPGAFAKRSDVGAGTEEFLTAGVLAYEGGRAVEVGRLGRGAEDIREEEVADAALGSLLVLRFPTWRRSREAVLLLLCLPGPLQS